MIVNGFKTANARINGLMAMGSRGVIKGSYAFILMTSEHTAGHRTREIENHRGSTN
jgi:hypothetical protein